MQLSQTEVQARNEVGEAATVRAATALLEEERQAAQAAERAKQQKRAKKARQKLRKQVRWQLVNAADGMIIPCMACLLGHHLIATQLLD